MYQVVVGGMVNCAKESFELAGIPMHQDEVCDHVPTDLSISGIFSSIRGTLLLHSVACSERANDQGLSCGPALWPRCPRPAHDTARGRRSPARPARPAASSPLLGSSASRSEVTVDDVKHLQ